MCCQQHLYLPRSFSLSAIPCCLATDADNATAPVPDKALASPLSTHRCTSASAVHARWLLDAHPVWATTMRMTAPLRQSEWVYERLNLDLQHKMHCDCGRWPIFRCPSTPRCDIVSSHGEETYVGCPPSCHPALVQVPLPAPADLCRLGTGASSQHDHPVQEPEWRARFRLSGELPSSQLPLKRGALLQDDHTKHAWASLVSTCYIVSLHPRSHSPITLLAYACPAGLLSSRRELFHSRLWCRRLIGLDQHRFQYDRHRWRNQSLSQWITRQYWCSHSWVMTACTE